MYWKRIDARTLAAILHCKAIFIEFAAGRFSRESDQRLRWLFENTP
jgi:hypothetical protein